MKNKTLEDFVQSILKEKNLSGVEQEILEQLKDEMVTRLESQINRALIDSLDDNQFDEFESLVKSKNTEKIKTFFTDKGVPVEAIMARVLTKFRISYLGS